MAKSQAKVRKFQHINEERFQAVKLLLRTGMKSGAIRAALGVSVGTIGLIGQSEDFAGYKDAIAKRYSDKKLRAEIAKQAPQTSSNDELLVKIYDQNRLILAGQDEMRENIKFLSEHVPVIETKRFSMFSRSPKNA